MSEARLPLVPAGDKTIWLTNARIIDGNGGDPVENGALRVENDRIAWVGTADEVPQDAGAAVVVDLGGATVMPGFFDCHVHFGVSIEDDMATSMARFPSERVFVALRNMHSTLMAGVTTARDLGGIDPGFSSGIASGTVLGPRSHYAVSVLSPTGGHADHHLPNGQFIPMLETPVDPIIDTEDDVRRAVRLLMRTGADVIKVCTTGGVSSPSDTPDDVGVPAEHVSLIKHETAKRQNQPVAAHAQGAEGIKEGLRGGVTSIEHGYGIDDEGIRLMLENDTYLVPTLSSALRVPDPKLVPPFLYKKKVRWSSIARERVAEAIKAGVKVALGTDAGICPHGVNLVELGHMVELGLTPMQAIVAGTRTSAELLRLEEHLGTLEAGKLADIVITDTDPLTDIVALGTPDTIDTVIQGGRLVKDTKSRFPYAAATAQIA